jgi:predicted O-methyltransferase YrrM
MNLIKIIKKFLFIQNITASIIAKFPPYLEFTVGKYLAIKKALYITAHDKTLGSYLEFGVFTGSSFNFAMKANKSLDKILGESNCDFVGFDSFEGFGKIDNNDHHPRFKDETFSVDEKKILENIKKNSKNQNYQIVKGFYKNTLKKKPYDYGIKKARVIMIDCDLKEPTVLALNFIKDILQKGTIILFDDYIFYKGDLEKGEYAAFEEFKSQNPNIKFRPAFEYGYGSKAFIVSNI